jgi:uncharacterized membrane protein
MGKLGVFLFVVCLIVGLYFLNSALSIITLPAAIAGIDSSLRIIGGILIVIGGFFMFKLGKKKEYRSK